MVDGDKITYIALKRYIILVYVDIILYYFVMCQMSVDIGHGKI